MLVNIEDRISQTFVPPNRIETLKVRVDLRLAGGLAFEPKDQSSAFISERALLGRKRASLKLLSDEALKDVLFKGFVNLLQYFSDRRASGSRRSGSRGRGDPSVNLSEPAKRSGGKFEVSSAGA